MWTLDLSHSIRYSELEVCQQGATRQEVDMHGAGCCNDSLLLYPELI